MARLNGLGFDLPESGLTRRPGVKPAVWTERDRVAGLVAVLDDLLARARLVGEAGGSQRAGA